MKKKIQENILFNTGNNYKKVNQEIWITFSIYQLKDTNENEMNYLKLLNVIFKDGKLTDSRNYKVLSIFSPP